MVINYPEKECRYLRLLAYILDRKVYQHWEGILKSFPIRIERYFRIYNVQVTLNLLEDTDDYLNIGIDVDFGRVINEDEDDQIASGLFSNGVNTESGGCQPLDPRATYCFSATSIIVPKL